METLGIILKSLQENKGKHLHYLLRKLGFQDNSIQDEYLNKLFKKIKAAHGHWTEKFYDRYGDLIGERAYNDGDFAELLLKEIKEETFFKNTFFGDVEYVNQHGVKSVLRRISGLKKPIVANRFITATDIASYVYCPVSYCIKSSFDEDKPTEESISGTELHEENRLVSLTGGGKGKQFFTDSGKGKGFYNQYNFEFFDDIRNSKIHYVGHDQASQRYFKSSKGQLVGQPDYVFINKAGVRYVVEEKFRLLSKQSNVVKQHHKAQLSAYILGLDELDAKYGYLVYWYYIYEDEKRVIKKCVDFKVAPTAEDREILRKTYRAITALTAGEKLEFTLGELNAAKCANCVVSKYCGHKTGRFNEMSVPYEKDFYSLMSS